MIFKISLSSKMIWKLSGGSIKMRKRKQLLKSLHHDMCVCFSFFSRHPRSWAVASATEGSLRSNRSRMSSLTRFCSCPRLYKYARRKQHTEMRHIAVSRPDLWQLVPRLLSVSCVWVCVCVCVWGGVGGGGPLLLFPLAPLPPEPRPSLCCSCLQVNQEDQKPGFNF